MEQQSLYQKYKKIVELYNNQPNLAHRTSSSIKLQQYSTPAPLAFMMGAYCGIYKDGLYFESSAGNGLLTIAGKPENFIVNEIDEIRRRNLQSQGFKEVWSKDASKPFGCNYKEYLKNKYERSFYAKIGKGNRLGQRMRIKPDLMAVGYEVFAEKGTKALAYFRKFNFIELLEEGNYILEDNCPTYNKYFDAILTNPPFGSLDETVMYDSSPINSLEQLMSLRALDTMKDDGKAAIIIGGHNEYDNAGRIKSSRSFFVYLFSRYEILDLINISGRELYSRQGTSFNTRIILVGNRKNNIGGFPPIIEREMSENEIYSPTPVTDFETLYNRISKFI